MRTKTRLEVVGLCLGMTASLGAAPLIAEPQYETPFFLGVQTHFVQGWRLEFLDLLPDLGATVLRDELSWPGIEAVPGRYFFRGDRTSYLARAIDMGLDPMILFTDTNSLYDDGMTPFSSEGQAAMAAYVTEIIAEYSPALRRIEIGNEFNSADFVSGPFTEDRPRYFSAMLRAVHEAVKDAHPDTEILCTGTHSVAIGFFRALFENGVLVHCDAISLHLYNDQPELVATELGRLHSLMEEFGRVLPIYVTEFGKWFDHPDDAPDFMLKMVAQMGEAGVAGAWWYALLDQPFWPNMGLYLPETREPMPAADSFRLLQETLLPLGRPRQIGAGANDQIYAFGDPIRAIVAWGAPANLETEGVTQFLDARGRTLSAVTELSDTPVVFLGEDLDVRVTRDQQVTNVHYGFAQSPWEYYAVRPDGSISELDYIDWEWSSFLGDPNLRPLLVSHDWISGVMFNERPYYAIERFIAPATGEYQVTARWYNPEHTDEDGADIKVMHNDIVLAEGIVAAQDFSFGPTTLSLAVGDRIDFAVGPNEYPGGDAVRREITIHHP